MYLIYSKYDNPFIVEMVEMDEKELLSFYDLYSVVVVDLKTNKYLVGTEEDPIHGVISKWEQIPQRYK